MALIITLDFDIVMHANVMKHMAFDTICMTVITFGLSYNLSNSDYRT